MPVSFPSVYLAKYLCAILILYHKIIEMTGCMKQFHLICRLPVIFTLKSCLTCCIGLFLFWVFTSVVLAVLAMRIYVAE